jgi:HEAT repeat protein
MNLDLVRKNLTSPSTQEVLTAVQLIGKHGALSDLQSALALLKHTNASVKAAAIEAACTLIRENLISNFHGLDAPVREKLGTLLNTLSPTIIDELSKDLLTDNEQRRLRAVQIIGLLKKNPRIHDVLARLIWDKDQKIRATAVLVLGACISFEDKELILSLLNDTDKRVRANTIEALERIGNKRLIPILLRYRNDKNNRIRGNVLKALYTLGYTEIETDLEFMLKSTDHYMKATALWVIAQTKIAGTGIENLSGFFLLSENQMVIDNAQKALTVLDTPRSRGFLRYLYPIAATVVAEPPKGETPKTAMASPTV